MVSVAVIVAAVFGVIVVAAIGVALYMRSSRSKTSLLDASPDHTTPLNQSSGMDRSSPSSAPSPRMLPTDDDLESASGARAGLSDAIGPVPGSPAFSESESDIGGVGGDRMRHGRVPEIPFRKLQPAIKAGSKVAAGHFGEVYRCTFRGKVVAVKRIVLNNDSEKQEDDFRKEITILGNQNHSAILPIYGACTKRPNLCFVCEFMERGSLFDVLRSPTAAVDLTWPRRLNIALTTARGMSYLHSRTPRIVHRDLKSMNLLVSQDWELKICDFGISREQHRTYLSTKHQAGSPAWMAPETLRGERSTEKVDVYSFGVILWELMTLALPWEGNMFADVVRLVGLERKHLAIPDPLPAGCPTGMSSLILLCFQDNHRLRPSFDRLVVMIEDIAQGL